MKKFSLLPAVLISFLLFSNSVAIGQNYRVVVKVLSQDRQEPVEAARVKIEYSSIDNDFKEALTRYENTDWEGMAYREFGGSGYFKVTITHPDFETHTAVTKLLYCGNTIKCDVPVTALINRKASLKTLAINVVAQGDKPHIYDAQIRIDGGQLAGGIISSATDGNGNALINLSKKGLYTITISHVGFETIKDNVHLNDDEVAYFRSYEMKRTKEDVQRKVIVVVRSKNQQGVLARLSAAEVEFLGDLHTVKTTDGNGVCFANHSRAPGEALNVRVSKEGYKSATGTTTVNTKMDRGADYIEVVLEKEKEVVKKVSNIVVEVLDFETEKAVPGASVRLDVSDGKSKTGTTNSSGEAKFSGLENNTPGITAKVVVTKRGYEEKWSDITSELMMVTDNSERNFLVYLKPENKKPGGCTPSEAELFSKMTGSWKGYRMHITIGGSCGNVSGTWKVTEWCEGVEETYNASVARVSGTIKGKMVNGYLQVDVEAPPSPNNSKGTKTSGTCSIKSDGSLYCSFGCPGDLKKQ